MEVNNAENINAGDEYHSVIQTLIRRFRNEKPLHPDERATVMKKESFWWLSDEQEGGRPRRLRVQPVLPEVAPSYQSLDIGATTERSTKALNTISVDTSTDRLLDRNLTSIDFSKTDDSALEYINELDEYTNKLFKRVDSLIHSYNKDDDGITKCPDAAGNGNFVASPHAFDAVSSKGDEEGDVDILSSSSSSSIIVSTSSSLSSLSSLKAPSTVVLDTKCYNNRPILDSANAILSPPFIPPSPPSTSHITSSHSSSSNPAPAGPAQRPALASIPAPSDLSAAAGIVAAASSPYSSVDSSQSLFLYLSSSEVEENESIAAHIEKTHAVRPKRSRRPSEVSLPLEGHKHGDGATGSTRSVFDSGLEKYVSEVMATVRALKMNDCDADANGGGNMRNDSMKVASDVQTVWESVCPPDSGAIPPSAEGEPMLQQQQWQQNEEAQDLNGWSIADRPSYALLNDHQIRGGIGADMLALKVTGFELAPTVSSNSFAAPAAAASDTTTVNPSHKIARALVEIQCEADTVVERYSDTSADFGYHNAALNAVKASPSDGNNVVDEPTKHNPIAHDIVRLSAPHKDRVPDRDRVSQELQAFLQRHPIEQFLGGGANSERCGEQVDPVVTVLWERLTRVNAEIDRIQALRKHSSPAPS